MSPHQPMMMMMMMSNHKLQWESKIIRATDHNIPILIRAMRQPKRQRAQQNKSGKNNVLIFVAWAQI